MSKIINVSMLITLCLILLGGSIRKNENTSIPGNVEAENRKDTMLKIDYNPIPMNLIEGTEDEFSLVGGLSSNYFVLENINTQLIDEVKADIILEDHCIPLVREVTDGYIVGVMETDFLVATTNKEFLSTKKPAIYKIGKDGQLLWKQTYDYSFKGGSMTNLLTYEDGRILFSVSYWPTVSMGSPVNEKTYLIQCDREGNESWKQTYDDYIGSLLKYIFITEDEEIIGVGEWLATDHQQRLDADSSDIVITCIDGTGSIIKQNSFGGEDNEYCQGAVYDQDVGIVITGWTLSKTGDFVTQTCDGNYRDYIACIDETLNLKWVKNPNEDERYNYDQISVKDGLVYAVGYSLMEEQLSSVFWQKLNKDGEEILKQYAEGGLSWGAKLCVLENNDVVIGSGSQNQGMLIIYNDKGEKIDQIDNLGCNPYEIIATADQGFIVKSIREIKALPQPIYLSCIWMDVEVAIIKYNNQYDLEWRKIVDDYKEEIRVDFVLPIGN